MIYRNSFWICIIATSMLIVGTEHRKVKSMCPVSDLKLACSSSNSALFKWKLTSWKGSCQNQIMTIKYIQQGTDINHYDEVDILKKEVLIKELEIDKTYDFSFVHKMKYNDKISQVENGYKAAKATPTKIGGVVSMNVTDIQPMSAVVVWSTPDNERKCISHYELRRCWSQSGAEVCDSQSNITAEELELRDLTPCTSYSLTVTAVDIDGGQSSATASHTFTTASRVPGVKDLSVHAASPDSLSASWVGLSCAPYRVSIYDLNGGLSRLIHWNTTVNTSYTFTSLLPCSQYGVSVTQGEDEGNNGQTVWAYTSIVSNATVYTLRVSSVTDKSVSVFWHPPYPELKCVTGYSVQVTTTTDKVIQTRNTSNTELVIHDLKPCTSYRLSVVVVFAQETLSQGSINASARTNAPATLLNQRVENVSIISQTANSLSVVWDMPSSGSECLQGYRISLYDSKYSVVYSEPNCPAEYTSFTFTNLKQCEMYSISIIPDYGYSASYQVSHFQGQQESINTFTTTSDNVTVSNLKLEANWNSLQLWWRPPLGYEMCTRSYEVQVCVEGGCEGPVTVDATSYNLGKLLACTSYTAEVRAGHSYKVAAATGFTMGRDPVSSSQLEVANKSSESITIRWGVAEDFRNCKGQFVISLWDYYGYVNENIKIDHSVREHTVQRLRPCYSYSFTLTLTDFAGKPIINYPVVAGTTKASDDQKVIGLKVNPFRGGMTLEWSLDQLSKACVSFYQVSVESRDGSWDIYNTTASTFMWKGDPCNLEAASVQIFSGDQLVGQPAYILLKEHFEDLSKLSVKVTNVGAREATVQLISAGFTCVSDYRISWHRVANSSTANTAANLTVVVNQSAKLRQLDPCSTFSAVVTPRNGLREMGVLSTTLSTKYAEPVLIPSITTVTRGFNMSWDLDKPDTVYCLSHVKVTVRQQEFLQQDKVFSNSHKIIGNLIPCQKYAIVLESFGLEKKSGNIFYSGLKKVAPEVLSVPDKVTVLNVTRGSVMLDWDVGTSDSNMCEPYDLEVQCRPDKDFNVHVAGWRPAMVRLSRLQPYTPYNCELVVVNEAGRSNGTHVSFVTSEDVPSQPKNVTVVDSSSSEVVVTWDRPDQVPGVLTNYTVTVYNQTLTYPRPPECPAPPPGPRLVVVGGNATRAAVDGLSPAALVWVSVVAATGAGSGPPSKPVAATTASGVSDSVKNLNVTLGRLKVFLSWRLPCFTNGPLGHFLVSLSGSRPGHNTASHTWNVTAQKALDLNYSTSFNLSLLTAESLYTATVVPVGASGLTGQDSSLSFTVPSRIPAEPSTDVFFELPPVRTTRYTATVSLRSDLFPDTEGSIRYYAIIVTGNFTSRPLTGWILNHTWPTMKTWAAAIQSRPVATYQATQPWWDPFEEMDTTPFAIKQFILGTDQCSKTDLSAFCNGPLIPGNFYSVRIRAFTRTGYRDSQSITFQTVDPIVEAYLTILALVALAVVTTVAFTYLVVRGHNKWIKEKKSLEKTKFKTEVKKEASIHERLSLVSFINHVGNIVSSQSLLEEEYKRVTEMTQAISGTTNIARLAHNVTKNRYKDIIPYDSALVNLEGGEESSYINASHIKIAGKKSRCYIACQGPKEETSKDFWMMAIQYKVNIIVMLCMPCEEGRIKCFPYFPLNAGEVVTFGGISVYCTKEETFNHYTIRYLTVDKDGVNVKVQHFHFTQWPDKEALEKPELLVEFIQHIRKTTEQREEAMIVHCSAGVGRTGTFIIVDEFLRKIRNTWLCKLSVPNAVLQLREQRHNKMVQTQGQYFYIYKCLQYALEHHESFFERVRNAVVRRSKVDVGGEEMICMASSPGVRLAKDAPEAC